MHKLPGIIHPVRSDGKISHSLLPEVESVVDADDREILQQALKWVEYKGDELSPNFYKLLRYRHEWLVRRFMSYMVNRVFRVIILGTAPVLLSVAGPMDFIKDVMAVFFMTKLDDIDDAEDLIDHLQKIASDPHHDPEDPDNCTCKS